MAGDLASGQRGNCPFSKRLHPAEFTVNRMTETRMSYEATVEMAGFRPVYSKHSIGEIRGVPETLSERIIALWKHFRAWWDSDTCGRGPMKAVAVALVAVLFGFPNMGRSTEKKSVPPLVTAQKTIDLTLGSRSSKPKLSLQNALKIAEAHIVKEQIDAASYWLYQGKFGLYGDKATADKDKTPGWYFGWVKEGALGDYIEIFVSMDGKAMRLPSM